MKKSEFVDKVASQSGLSKKDADSAVEAVIKTIEDSLSKGEDVSFTNFGKAHAASRRAREGRNPRTGETMTISASKVPPFIAGSGLKTADVDKLLGEIKTDVNSSREALQSARALRALKE